MRKFSTLCNEGPYNSHFSEELDSSNDSFVPEKLDGDDGNDGDDG